MLLTLVALWPVTGNDFVAYDDTEYLTNNDVVRRGLSLSGLRWAFATTKTANWQPLTWLSHLLDVELFGLRPGWHHTVSLALHAASALLLWRLLCGLTGTLWRSALAATLFAVHPLHLGRALQHALSALPRQPRSPELNNNVRAILMSLGRQEEALAYLRVALATDPEFVSAIYNVGLISAEASRQPERRCV